MCVMLYSTLNSTTVSTFLALEHMLRYVIWTWHRQLYIDGTLNPSASIHPCSKQHPKWFARALQLCRANSIMHHSSLPPQVVIGHPYATLQKKPSPWESPYCESVMDTQAGNCIARQFMLVSHAQVHTHTQPLSLLQTKEMPIDRWQGQTLDRHYSQEIMLHTQRDTHTSCSAAEGWIKCWWRQHYEGECLVIRKLWW